MDKDIGRAMMTKRVQKSISWILPLFFIFFIIGNNGTMISSSQSDTRVESIPHPCPFFMTSVSWNPNSDLALIGSSQECAYLYDGDNFEQIWNANGSCSFYCSQWSPNGSFALLGSDRRIYTYDGNNFTFTEIGNQSYHGYNYHGIDFKPDGSQAIIVGSSTYWKGPNGVIVIFDGINLQIVLETKNKYFDVAWNPDSSYALIVGEEMIKYDGATFSTLFPLPKKCYGISWKPDGSYALLACYGSIWKYDGFSLTELYGDITYEKYPGVWKPVWLWDIEWNPNGDFALISGNHGRFYKYDGEDLDELQTETSDDLRDVDWRPDGKYALIVGERSILRYPAYYSNETIETTIDIDPNTLNLKSKGRWITCYITLNSPYDVNDIDFSTIMLEDSIPAEWGDIQGDTLMVKFDRSDVEDMLPPGTYNLKVTGELVDETSFEGYSDEIRVIDPGK